MRPILIAYGTTEGHTRRIAESMRERVRHAGYDVHLVDTATSEASQVAPIYVGALLGGSVHQGHHQTALTHFARENSNWLRGIPLGVFSVSLAAASEDLSDAREARLMLRKLVDVARLRPSITRCMAGALLYTRYDYLKRTLMRYIAGREGGPTDTSQDYIFTDWDDVERFVDEFLTDVE